MLFNLCISGLPLFELTTLANTTDASVVPDILRPANAVLFLRERTFLGDKGYDVKTVYNLVKDAYEGEAVIPLNKRGIKSPEKLSVGNPICEAGLAIVGKTIQRVLRTVKAVAGAVCLRGDILSHDEPIATAGEIRLKAFISVHQAASPKEERSPSEICPSSASAFFGGSFFSGSFFFSSLFFLETDLEDVFPR